MSKSTAIAALLILAVPASAWAQPELEGGGGPVDVSPPQTIWLSAVVKSSTSVELSWENAGDDGSIGQAMSLEAYHYTEYIDDFSVSLATRIGNEPAPGVTGSTQTWLLEGLATGRAYWFAIRAVDEVSNAGAVFAGSNAVVTLTNDFTAPGQVTAITSIPEETKVTLVFTAPGDDGHDVTGRCAGYEIRGWTSGPLTEADFSQAPVLYSALPFQIPAPVSAAGTDQQVVLGGLASGTPYHIALKAFDEVPNHGPLSVNVMVTTLPAIAPGAVGNLRIDGVDRGSITLKWECPGEDGPAGGACARFEVKYREDHAIVSPLDWDGASAANWGTGLAVYPMTPGLSFRATVNQLTPGVTYHFAVRAVDEVPLSGPFSSIMETTLPPVPPTEIDLRLRSADENSVTLEWLAPEAYGGAAAAGYELRYSLAPITDTGDPRIFSEWRYAPKVPSLWLPDPPGTAQSWRVEGLASETPYWFAIKSVDSVSTWSPMSVNVSVTTDPPTPPAAVHLEVISSTLTTVTLEWLAPGDDGMTGIAASYDIRCSSTGPIRIKSPSDPFDEFDRSQRVDGIPAPAQAGTLQTITVEALNPGSTWHFVFVSWDEMGNESPLSNSPGITMLPPADATAPSKIYDLLVTGTTLTSLSIRWTAPGDDGPNGRAALYELRVAAAPILDAAAFDAATAVTPAPPAAAPGTSQSFLMPGLAADTAYFVSIRAVDEAGNRGAVSNSPTGRTAIPDSTAPAAVTDLDVTSVTMTTMSLEWTAPGDDGSAGTASWYDARYSRSPILTDVDFDAATPVAGEPGPASGKQSVTVEGLDPGVRYHFALRTYDDAGNRSGRSNTTSEQTSTVYRAPVPPSPAGGCSQSAPGGPGLLLVLLAYCSSAALASRSNSLRRPA